MKMGMALVIDGRTKIVMEMKRDRWLYDPQIFSIN